MGKGRRRLAGHFLGSGNEGDVNVRLALDLDDDSSRWAVQALSGTEVAVVESDDRAVTRHLRQVEAAIQRENYRNRPILPFLKPDNRKSRKPSQAEMMLCPDCGGVAPSHCDTCLGIGSVPKPVAERFG